MSNDLRVWTPQRLEGVLATVLRRDIDDVFPMFPETSDSDSDVDVVLVVGSTRAWNTEMLAYDAREFSDRYFTSCFECHSPYPRTTPTREFCEDCLAGRMQERFVDFHRKVHIPEVRQRIMRFIVPTEHRFSEHKKFRLRVILCQALSPFRFLAHDRMPGEPKQFVFHYWLNEVRYECPTLLDHILTFLEC